MGAPQLYPMNIPAYSRHKCAGFFLAQLTD
jgi:hypothetical protein